jgi:hypothetical protein
MLEAIESLAPAHFGRALRSSRAELLEATRSMAFVAIRRSPGGPAPEKSAALAAYPTRIKNTCDTLFAE